MILSGNETGDECVTRRKLQTPDNAEEHNRQETPTINPIGPTDKPHRPSTKHYRKDSLGDAQHQHSSRARFSTTTHHQHPHPTGSSPDLFSQRSPLRSAGAIQAGWLRRRAEPHNTIDTTRLSGDTRCRHTDGDECVRLAAFGLIKNASSKPLKSLFRTLG